MNCWKNIGPKKKSEIRGSKSEVELRGWEWRYLWRLTRSDEIGTLGSHSNVVTCLACSPVAPLLASGSQDAAVKFWDLVARSNIATLPFPESIRSLAFAPDGKLLAIGCEDQSVRLYDLTAKREVARFPSKQFTGRFEGAVAFSAGGRTLAFNDPSSNIILWDVTTQSQIGFLDGPPGGITTLAFSPIGSTLASGGDGGNVRLWNLSTKSAIRDLDGGGEINAVAFSPDGKSLVSAGEPVKAWDVGTGRELARLTGHGAIVNAVAFSPDGKLIAGAVGQLIKLWDATTWTEINTLQGHFKNVWALAFSADGKILASGGKDETVRLWNLLAKREERSQLALPRRRKLIFGSVAFSTDGKTLLTLSDAGEAKVWDTVSLAEKSSVFLTDSNILEVAVDSGGTLIASGHADGKIKLWDCALRREMGNLNGHTGAVTSLRFSLDKKLLASASLALGSPAIKADHTIRLWDVAGHRQLSSFNNVPIYYSSAEFSPNNEILAVGGYPDGTVRLLGVRNGQELGTLKGHKRPVDGVAFSPDGRTLATASWDENVKLWDVGSQTEIATLRGHRTAVHSAVFSPDGRRIVSSAAEDSLKLWDVTTSQEVASLAVGRPFFWAYFADNDTIVTLVNAGKDEVALNLRVLRAASLAEIDAAEKAKARGK